MKFHVRQMGHEMRLISIAVLIACLPLFAALGSAQENPQSGFTDPAEIDRAVAGFTGAGIGETGGARMPADRRLRLASCPQPLETSWHGRPGSTVAVACAGPHSWRIFISVNAHRAAAASVPVVERGDPITVAVKGRGFTVQHAGEALEKGAVGEWIAVRTSRSAEPIRARIERPGLAIIPVD
ncbi:MAG: flagella basal body P-ring formation protein FlgA [Erythrobacter sp.]